MRWVFFGNGTSYKMSAEENAKRCRESGFSEDANSEDYSDLYYWCSVSHPDLDKYQEWYKTGEKNISR